VAVAENKGNVLGETLKAARELQDKSLKAVAEPAEISAAYLLKLEKGEVASPSPHVLHRIAEQLGLDYMDLMRLAGYVVPDSKPQQAGALAQALSSQNLTDDEARAVAAYLKMYRSTGRG
jgi:HTH-type transcriptional regulator, competence development regulator